MVSGGLENRKREVSAIQVQKARRLSLVGKGLVELVRYPIFTPYKAMDNKKY